MGKIINEWVKSVLTENIKKTVVVYSGRFQPFHSGHYATYKHLVGKFGKDSVYIGTSNKTDSLKSPFKFNDKKEIMVKMFGIPSSKIVQVKNPYAPKEIIGKFNEKTTALVTVVGEKDRYRLRGKYFDPYHPDKIQRSYKEKGYVYVAPEQPNPVSGTQVRRELTRGSDSKRRAYFKKTYGQFNAPLFNKITNKLVRLESVMERFLQSFDISSVISETNASNIEPGEPEDRYTPAGKKRTINVLGKEEWLERGGYTQMHFPIADDVYPDGWDDETEGKDSREKSGHNPNINEPKTATTDFKTVEIDGKVYDVNDNKLQDKLDEASSNSTSTNTMPDDGPGFLYGNFKTYKAVSDEVASRLGFEVIDYIMDEDSMESFDTEYPKGAGRYPVSFFPSGIEGEGSARYGAIRGKEMKETPAFKKWAKHIRKVATIVGYKLIDFMDAEESTEKSTISEGVSFKELGITNFKSLFKKMPSNLQKRVYNLKNTKQRTDKHPEGNVLKHTIVVVNRSIKDDDIDIAIAAMFHDIGKDETAGIHPKKGHITHYGHERVSASLVKQYRDWIESVGGNTTNVYYIVKNHMKYKQLSSMRPHKQMKLKSFRAYDKLGKFSKHDRGGLGESLINEGGAYGHMAHPFDVDMNLTFGDLKQIISGALTGKLELTREKTDGQALAISWRDDKGLIAARNKSHLKNSGEGALNISGVASKFQGRGGLTDAYNFAMEDLTSAIKSLSKAQRDKIFQQGSSFMNLEVIYPTSVNVIPYGQPLLVFHGTMQYDVDGKAIGENQGAARTLAGMIKQINKDVQDNYTIQGPPVVELPKAKELSNLQSKFSSKVNKLQSEYGLNDSDGVADYHQAWWESWVDKNTPSTIDNKIKMGLVKRWAFMDKSFRLDKKNISDVTVLDWAKKIDKQDQKKLTKDNLRKFEDIFLGVGAEVLSFMSSVLTVNSDSAIRGMKKRLDQTIKDVKKSGDVKKIEKLKMELERLSAAGGKQKIVPNEGIVFVYKGNTYKLTGTFAPLNQILGLMYF